MKRFSWILACVLMNLSCSRDAFKKYVVLGDLRVLAIVIDNAGKAEGSPGDTFIVTPYVSDLNSSGTIIATGMACVDPGVGYGATPTCVGSSTAQTLTVSNLTAPLTAAAGAIAVTIPSAILIGRSSIDKYNGVYYLVTYDLTNSNGQTVKSFKRIPISDPTKTSKNSNPTIASVLADGAPLGTLAAGVSVQLSLAAGAGSSETYTYYSSSGVLSTNTERMQTTWFYSDGETNYFRTEGTDSTKYTAPSSFPTSRSSLIVAVLRDGRGGEAVQKVVIHP